MLSVTLFTRVGGMGNMRTSQSTSSMASEQAFALEMRRASLDGMSDSSCRPLQALYGAKPGLVPLR
jgi:hypothetical protein